MWSVQELRWLEHGICANEVFRLELILRRESSKMKIKEKNQKLKNQKLTRLSSSWSCDFLRSRLFNVPFHSDNERIGSRRSVAVRGRRMLEKKKREERRMVPGQVIAMPSPGRVEQAEADRNLPEPRPGTPDSAPSSWSRRSTTCRSHKRDGASSKFHQKSFSRHGFGSFTISLLCPPSDHLFYFIFYFIYLSIRFHQVLDACFYFIFLPLSPSKVHVDFFHLRNLPFQI